MNSKRVFLFIYFIYFIFFSYSSNAILENYMGILNVYKKHDE
jgi:hypothetical protein